MKTPLLHQANNLQLPKPRRTTKSPSQQHKPLPLLTARSPDDFQARQMYPVLLNPHLYTESLARKLHLTSIRSLIVLLPKSPVPGRSLLTIFINALRPYNPVYFSTTRPV